MSNRYWTFVSFSCLTFECPTPHSLISDHFDIRHYSCGLSTPTIEYSCPSGCLSVCVSMCPSVCVCACVHDNSKNNGSIHLKLEHIVVYQNSSEEFDIGHCPIKLKVTV